MQQNKVAGVCIASVVYAAAGVVSNARAEIIYGDGTTKPGSYRAVFAEAGASPEVWSSHAGGPASSNTNGYFSGFEQNAAMAATRPRDFATFASADAFQESRLGEEALSFTMWARASVVGNYGWAQAGSTLNAWMLVTDETPYYLFKLHSDSSPATMLQLFNEDGSEVDLGFHGGDQWAFAQGTLAGGWYHLSIDASSNPMWGSFGVPTPGSASLLALGGLAMTRRRR